MYETGEIFLFILNKYAVLKNTECNLHILSILMFNVLFLLILAFKCRFRFIFNQTYFRLTILKWYVGIRFWLKKMTIMMIVCLM
jgi:hypothetical protein